MKPLLRIGGASEDEIESFAFADKTDEEIEIILEKGLKGLLSKNGNGQKVVPMDEIEKYIEEGWEYVNELPGDKAIVRIPL